MTTHPSASTPDFGVDPPDRTTDHSPDGVFGHDPDERADPAGFDREAPRDRATDEPAVPEGFDDSDSSPNRFGGLDPSSMLAHRVVTPPLLAGLTGIDLATCRAFHDAFFTTLEDVGDFDGLVVWPVGCLARSGDLLDIGAASTLGHPVPATASILSGIELEPESGMSDDAHADAVQAVVDALSGHSLRLAAVSGSNPSLTFGSIDALVVHLIDGLLDELPDAVPGDTGADIKVLTEITLDLLGCLADTDVQVVGGARVRLFDVPADDLGGIV